MHTLQGYTIPLDKRLAADGRGLQTTVINDKFASLSEALFTAESKAREAITLRAAMQKELLLKEKSKKESELRELAMKARMEKAGPGAAAGGLAARLDTGGLFNDTVFIHMHFPPILHLNVLAISTFSLFLGLVYLFDFLFRRADASCDGRWRGPPRCRRRFQRR